jgi:hypothetical protein
MNYFQPAGGNGCCFRAEAVGSQLASDNAAPGRQGEGSGRKDEQCNDDLDERATRLIRYGHTAILCRSRMAASLQYGTQNGNAAGISQAQKKGASFDAPFFPG